MSKSKTLQPRFSLRMAMALFATATCVIGFWASANHATQRQNKTIEDLGGHTVCQLFYENSVPLQYGLIARTKHFILEPFSPILEVNLGGSTVSDEELDFPKQLKTSILDLNLRDTKISDAAVLTLATFENLRTLDLEDTQITDAALPAFAKFKNLQRLNLRGTSTTVAGVESFKIDNPRIAVELDFDKREFQKIISELKQQGMEPANLQPIIQ